MTLNQYGLPVTDEGFVLALLKPKADFGGLPKFAASNVVLPREQWVEVDFASLAVPVLNQGSHGSCVGHGSVSAYWFSYLMQGGTVPDSGFSPTSLYALINGGHDGGAIVSDAMTKLMSDGICTMAECGENMIYIRQIPSSAAETRKRFKVQDAYHTTSFDQIGSALSLGYPVSFGITIKSGFNRPGADGLISPGGWFLGGHCMCGYGLVKLGNGKWGIRVRNSWGTQWGLNGNCILVEEHFGRDCDAFAVMAALGDPLDPNLPPIAKASNAPSTTLGISNSGSVLR